MSLHCSAPQRSAAALLCPQLPQHYDLTVHTDQHDPLLPAVPRYVTNLQQEQAHGLPYPDDPVDQYRATHGLDNSTRKPRSNDLTTMVEAQLGKPTHLLEEDKLKQFLQVGTWPGWHVESLLACCECWLVSWAVWGAALWS